MIEIVFPVLNEERRLRHGIDETCRFIRAHSLPISLVIADNGSSDRTFEIAQELADKYAVVRVVRVPRKGVGLALKTAWLSSHAEYVGYMDIDLATKLDHLKQVVELMRGGNPPELITGSRLLPESKVIGRSFLRSVTSRGFNFILKKYLRVTFSDGMCGFKFIRRTTFQKLLRLFDPPTDGWFFNAEIMIKTQAMGAKVFEIPVEWIDDGDSRVKLLSLTLTYLNEMRRTKFDLDRNYESLEIKDGVQ